MSGYFEVWVDYAIKGYNGTACPLVTMDSAAVFCPPGEGMSQELISKATRNTFREALTGFTLHDIRMMFEAAGLEPRLDYQSRESGQRRNLVEQYYANMDFSSVADARKFFLAYKELIDHLDGVPDGIGRSYEAERTIRGLEHRMEQDGFHYDRQNDEIISDVFQTSIVEAESLVALTKDSITEHLNKARAKIEAGDNSGAISSAYTLIEGFLKELLHRTGTSFKEDEGDLRELYRLAAGPLNLEPRGKNLESYLKAILQGLKSQVSGLYEVANKAGDRHVRKYNPAKHHAKLAVNAAFTLCEFLLDSFEYQAHRKKRNSRS